VAQNPARWHVIRWLRAPAGKLLAAALAAAGDDQAA